MDNPKIFGIGLSKTGTSSLCQAMNILGYRVKHYILEPDYLTIIDQYDFINDMPIQCRYKELDQIYIGSKFILSVRENIDKWLDSCKRQWLKKTSNQQILSYRIEQMGSINFNREQFVEKYQDHKNNVMSYFSNRSNDFLVLDIFNDDPWIPLCKFLDKTVPQEPFPHLNRSELA